VLRLLSDQPLTPAAGRRVGFGRTSAEFVLFLDGDMELRPHWLARAFDVLDELPRVAAVTGVLTDVTSTDSRPPLDESPPDKVRAVDVRHPGGAAMYRRAVLDEVGSFNPYLDSDEEPELCVRIRAAEYHIVWLDVPMAFHYTRPEGAPSLLARRRRRLYLGQGQAMRYLLGTGQLWPYARERHYAFVPALALLAGVVSVVVSAATGVWAWAGAWAGLVVVVVVADSVRRRSVTRMVNSVLNRLLTVEGTIRGFAARPHDPESYPARVEVIK
jgi:cellulose synthase/poly-beta-1,6-N-acetylglucosamine synthase-like glycosyltransferase